WSSHSAPSAIFSWSTRSSRMVRRRCSFAVTTTSRNRPYAASSISSAGKRPTWARWRPPAPLNHCACFGASPASFATSGLTHSSSCAGNDGPAEAAFASRETSAFVSPRWNSHDSRYRYSIDPAMPCLWLLLLEIPFHVVLEDLRNLFAV